MSCANSNMAHDIEDLSCFDKLHTIAYDNLKLRPSIDKFVNENLNITTWRTLEKKMREFQKINKFTFQQFI